MVKLDGPQKDSDFVDPRHCLVFWARPPQRVKNLVEIIQQKLKDAAPGSANLLSKPSSLTEARSLDHAIEQPPHDSDGSRSFQISGGNRPSHINLEAEVRDDCRLSIHAPCKTDQTDGLLRFGSSGFELSTSYRRVIGRRPYS